MAKYECVAKLCFDCDHLSRNEQTLYTTEVYLQLVQSVLGKLYTEWRSLGHELAIAPQCQWSGCGFSKK